MSFTVPLDESKLFTDTTDAAMSNIDTLISNVDKVLGNMTNNDNEIRLTHYNVLDEDISIENELVIEIETLRTKFTRKHEENIKLILNATKQEEQIIDLETKLEKLALLMQRQNKCQMQLKKLMNSQGEI